VARELNVAAQRLSQWREIAHAAAAAALKERERDARDDEIARLKAKIGEITMDNELLSQKIARLETARPLSGRRSRR
jgi:anti-sigma28 factor (negative regulator of flagellin synthesis)